MMISSYHTDLKLRLAEDIFATGSFETLLVITIFHHVFGCDRWDYIYRVQWSDAILFVEDLHLILPWIFRARPPESWRALVARMLESPLVLGGAEAGEQITCVISIRVPDK